ncbi:unnamed protein product [Onchocerca flexuosa]|nr:unnamed protein product [Onchocerca flexuosa]
MVGLFGSIISGIQLAALEHHELASVNWSGTIVVFYLIFIASMFLFYSMVSVVVKKSSALMFNLSILTADFYTLVFGLFMFKYEFHALYFVSFALVMIGSLIYSIRETERRDPDEPHNICCLICHCCTDDDNGTDDDNQSLSIPQQYFAQTSSVRIGSGIGTANNTAMYGATAYPKTTNMKHCPVHGRQVPFLQQQQQQQQPIDTLETYT